MAHLRLSDGPDLTPPRSIGRLAQASSGSQLKVSDSPVLKPPLGLDFFLWDLTV